ncbi:MAG: ABC transporter ATP-binding protein [Dehalococcoidia bacterium]|nr:ABC transporter ATP-binding protein [Dehalococcoidia bacterium]
MSNEANADPLRNEPSGSRPVVSAQALTKLFPVSHSWLGGQKSFVHAVDDISFDLMGGESLGLVGESGCGKTTTGKLLVRLIEPTAGHIQFDDGTGNSEDIAILKGASLKAFRKKAQMVFQDPYESLNPRQTVFDAVSEPLRVQNIGGPAERIERVSDMLVLVGLSPPSTFLFRYPHELSGGQRQRVVIARALVVEPTFVVADEPTSMLDVSVRTGIMRLMDDLGDRLGITYVYITHDLAVARYMCNRIAVMYLGKIVEVGETEQLLSNPQHPYTKALLSAVPVPDPASTRDPVNIKGGVTTPVDPPPRCRFYDRCPIADNFCRDNVHPPLEDKGAGQFAACYKV